MEQPIFCVGDKVVCIDSSGYEKELTEGKKYTIKAVDRTPCCKLIGVSVGVTGNYVHHNCIKCGRIFPYKGSNLYRQTRFVPLDTNSQLEEAIFESLKGAKILDKL